MAVLAASGHYEEVTDDLDDIRTIVAQAAWAWRRSDLDRTERMKAAAAALVRARGMLVTNDGQEDVAGRSGAYRALVTSALDEAQLLPNRRPAFLANLRHHTSVRLREVYSDDVLTAYGMGSSDAPERLRGARRALRERTAWMRPERLVEDEDVAAFATTTADFLSRVDPARLSPLSREYLENVRNHLTRVLDTPPPA